jgi:outer membrane protein assembly factor BamB
MHLTFLLALALRAEPAPVTTWPGFRGDGSSRTAARDLPLRWSPAAGVAWRAALPGYGQSSPVVWKDRVFVTAVQGRRKEKCLVLALAARTGEILWQKGFRASQPGANNPSVSRAAPTPAVDPDGVYVFFEGGDLLALTHGGAVRWRRSLVKEYGALKNHHGLAASLAQTDRAVLVLVEHSGTSYLLAVEKATGRNLWKADRKSGLSWTSPVVTRHGGRDLVLVSSAGTLTAYDAGTGEELWAFGGLHGNVVPSPTAAGDLVVVGAGESGLTSDLRAAARSNCALRLNTRDGKSGCALLWQGQKAVGHHASPLIHRGHVYLVTKAGVVYCRDAQTGVLRYAERLADPCWATPVGAGDRVYFFGKDGVTTVLKAGSKFERLAVNRLWAEDDFAARKEAAKERPENQFPPLPPPPKGKKGSPSVTREQMERMLRDAVGDVVYGVAAVDRTFFLRTGTELICVRNDN